jgi:peroxiredoxin
MTEDDEALGFDVLPDPLQEVIRLYRLQYTVPQEVQQIYTGLFNTDMSQHNQDGSWNIPVPGTFVIDQLGIIRRRHVTADYTQRMEPDDIVAALRAIESPAGE